jgi:cyclic pyranopterin phosphate synthase
MSKFSHLDETGAARMVDVSAKVATEREAVAEGYVTISEEAISAIAEGAVAKGDVLSVARIAGIMAAKKKADLIPLCHPLALTGASVELEIARERSAVLIRATIKTTGPTGVEMEALTAVSVAALALYDMIKAIDKTATIENVHLVSKSGGKSGKFVAPGASGPRKALSAPLAATTQRGRAAVLMEATAASPSRKSPSTDRQAFRSFMLERRLRASVWASEAGVASSQIYAYLTGRLNALPFDVLEKLARAARVSPEDIFR